MGRPRLRMDEWVRSTLIVSVHEAHEEEKGNAHSDAET